MMFTQKRMFQKFYRNFIDCSSLICLAGLQPRGKPFHKWFYDLGGNNLWPDVRLRGLSGTDDKTRESWGSIWP